MKNRNLLSITGLAVLGLFLISITGCKKEIALTVPEELAHFADKTTGAYFITGPNVSYTITVGVTTVSAKDRTVSFTTSSPTGAVSGTHYNVSASSVVIPAGQATATFTIQGVQSLYTSGRKDTIVFTIEGTGVKPADYNGTFKLFMRGPCFDGDVDAAARAGLLGDYNNCNDDGFGPYGPYKITVVSITPLTATTARAVLENVWDYGFGNVNFIMDWTDPNNTTIKVESPTITPADAGALNPAYNGMQLVIRDHASASSSQKKFSVCTGTIRLAYQLGVYDPASSTILGYFPNVGTTVMNR